MTGRPLRDLGASITGALGSPQPPHGPAHRADRDRQETHDHQEHSEDTGRLGPRVRHGTPGGAAHQRHLFRGGRHRSSDCSRLRRLGRAARLAAGVPDRSTVGRPVDTWMTSSDVRIGRNDVARPIYVADRAVRGDVHVQRLVWVRGKSSRPADRECLDRNQPVRRGPDVHVRARQQGDDTRCYQEGP